MTVRWGIAGTGGIAEAMAADLARVSDAELVAIGSRRPETARAFAEAVGRDGLQGTHGEARAHDYAGLVADDGVDAIYVATPHPQHRDLALACLRAGRAVLVEKAFTATLAGAEEVVRTARETGTFCMEAMWTRFVPAVVRARQLVADGAIGTVRTVQADLGAYRTYDPTSRLFDPALGGGATLDLGVYVVSIAQHFLGDPDRVHAAGTTYPNGTDASVGILLGYDDGRSATLTCSLEAASPARAVLLGDAGSIELMPRFHHPERLVLRRNGHPPEEIREPVRGAGYLHEVEEVHRCLAGGLAESEVMPLRDTLGVQRVLQEVLDQLGCPVAEGAVPGL
ncbi:Gfo/Idh/MocA family protein [Nocardioides donggukensis]|uniref:Gfo/Idh/MocA family oxidoreductase n=1 Tax=Nocardioides donggukensis TaxID=2774019 RepID=A0A927K275_9ACTN|nr:Gfo/Idh/MocA family oxidoreductase [Nocardioides donggukensis]MBD8868053.1 Gfo/Idh/MocA family oxidoreductase [Nocardioides donggukensis]